MNTIIRRINGILTEITRHALSAYAAQSAFYIIVSFFPFTMLMLTMLKYLPFTEEEFVALLTGLAPETVGALIADIVSELYRRRDALIPITLITALWSASKGVYAVIRGLNSVYECRETRGYFRLRLLAIGYTLLLQLVLVLTVFLMLTGEWLISQAQWLFRIKAAVTALRIVASALLLSVFFSLIYRMFPARRARARDQIPGAAFSAAGWVLFSEIYSVYLSHGAGSLYGSLTALVFAMLWLYTCMYILLEGGEVNRMLSRE